MGIMTEKQKKIYPRRIIPRFGYGPLDGSLTCTICYCELDNPSEQICYDYDDGTIRNISDGRIHEHKKRNNDD